ncbi:aspartate aminotransferase family protein [Nocardioides bruguierae]|uniref:aspartate aminotransferase family protein n=1 Tax=Nocardioides bruguierae TaxID=2945102 RepID=UPI0020212FD7|nr:aspartate aminotransferase family protein [Nocardioides bruguierae]MCL8026106.1 aspartate aminotransferase family protein [Nocardioides bruguierae]
MTDRSSILDANAFDASALERLDPESRVLAQRRAAVLGSGYRLFYRTPVQVVRGEGCHLWDAEGRRYLDLYNNVPSVGHAHPAVTAAVTAQMGQLNTHTRYLHEGVVSYAERLLGTMPDALERLVFLCTGSEANDLAIRVARAATGKRGLVISSEAYHGNTALVSGFSPALGPGQVLDEAVQLVPPPDPAAVAATGQRDVGAWFSDHVRRAVMRLQDAGHGVAGLLVDTVFSSDGVFPGVRGSLDAAARTVRRNGGLVIADEVQPGFARTGEAFWGFERLGLVPDLVTLGKPMGNGIPISALAAGADVLDAFAGSQPYFNTFGGNPVSVAAASAVLDVICGEGLQERARVVGEDLRGGLRDLGRHHPCLGTVRGVGQYTGIDVLDPATGLPDGGRALDLVEAARERGVLLSVAGPHGHVLKIRPPLVLEHADVEHALHVLDDALRSLA